MTYAPNLSTEITNAADQLAARAYVLDPLSPAEMCELADALHRMARYAERLQVMAGASAATMAAAELAAIESKERET